MGERLTGRDALKFNRLQSLSEHSYPRNAEQERVYNTMISDFFTMDMVWLGLVWALYFALHSLLAADSCKAAVAARWPLLWQRYRLFYNGVATLLILPLIAATEWRDAVPLWSWHGTWAWVSNTLGALALAGVVWSSRAYDLGEFLGLSPSRPSQALGLSAVHRFVRHPWYFFGLVWLWTRDMDSARLTAAVVITAYIVIGSYLEDRKLARALGEPYRRYHRQVPGLIPRPWRYLSHSEYDRLRAGESGTKTV